MAGSTVLMLNGALGVLGMLVTLLGATAALFVAIALTARRTNALAAWVLFGATAASMLLHLVTLLVPLLWRYVAGGQDASTLQWAYVLTGVLNLGAFSLYGVAFLLFRPERGAAEDPP